MIILLLIFLGYTFSANQGIDSFDSANLLDYERPHSDVVRQQHYARNIQNIQEGDEGMNANGIAPSGNMAIMNHSLSAEKMNAIQKYIASRTFGLCDFTCNNCYRCSLVYGKKGMFRSD